MASGLIGYSGFVGQNLNDGKFDFYYNSKNIEEIKGKEFSTLICAGVPGNKTLANQYPQKDKATIQLLMDCLKETKCKQFLLISTMDVYESYDAVDELTPITTSSFPYGENRIHMEQFVREYFANPYIVRLPGIYGIGLKKNFIYDLIYRIPQMIPTNYMQHFLQIINKEETQLLNRYYRLNDEKIYERIKINSETDLKRLQKLLEGLNYTSLQFTDSRSKYEYYHLNYLQNDIEVMLKHNIQLLNIAVEPMAAGEIASKVCGYTFLNHIEGKEPVNLNVKSRYAHLFEGKDGYLYGKDTVIRDLKEFYNNYTLYTTI